MGIFDLQDFRNYLSVECGLSPRTLEAYQRDITRFFASSGTEDPGRPGERELLEFSLREKKRGLAPASLARALVAIRMFYRFLVAEKLVATDPFERVEYPKLWQKLPSLLAPEEVAQLLAAPAGNDPLAVRDRALLETLYATGSRVSEVAGLELEHLNLSLSFARCLGKGNKERLVPLHRRAVEELQRYLAEARPRLA